MELFVLEGRLEDISTFVGKIRATKDTLTVDYSVTPVDEFGADSDLAATGSDGTGDGEANRAGGHAHDD